MSSYPYPWPIGTCHYYELPLDIQESLAAFLDDGVFVDNAFPVQKTATEGPFINYAGWKVRVMIVDTSPTTYIVRIV